MQEESAHELYPVQTRGFLFALVAIVFPAEGHFVVIHIEQARVRDGHPMGVASEVLDDAFGVCERAFGIHYPPVFNRGVQKLLKLTWPP
jgi:hypothetical protein